MSLFYPSYSHISGRAAMCKYEPCVHCGFNHTFSPLFKLGSMSSSQVRELAKPIAGLPKRPQSLIKEDLSISRGKEKLTQQRLYDNSMISPVCSNASEYFKFIFWDVLHPKGLYKRIWDMLLVIMIFGLAVGLPVLISFGNTAGSNLFTVIRALDVFYALDIFMNLRTAFPSGEHQEGPLIWDRWKIAQQYVQSWLLVDLMSTIPWDLVVTLVGTLGGYINRKYTDFRSSLTNMFSPAFMRLSYTLIMAVAMIHVTACLYHWVSALSIEVNDRTWIHEQDLVGHTWYQKYYASLYWTIATLTTTGYGDSIPITVYEKCVAMVTMFMGLTSFSYLITAMSRAMDMLNAHDLRSIALQQMKSAARANDVKILNMLSSGLRRDVLMHMYASLLTTVDFFKDKSDDFLCNLILNLNPQVVTPGELVIVQGMRGHEMYFVKSGLLEYRESKTDDDVQRLLTASSQYAQQSLLGTAYREYHQQYHEEGPNSTQSASWKQWLRELIVPVIKPGNFFGEQGIIGRTMSASVLCVEHAELLSLAKKDFIDLMKQYPQYVQQLGLTVEDLEGLASGRQKGHTGKRTPRALWKFAFHSLRRELAAKNLMNRFRPGGLWKNMAANPRCIIQAVRRQMELEDEDRGSSDKGGAKKSSFERLRSVTLSLRRSKDESNRPQSHTPPSLGVKSTLSETSSLPVVKQISTPFAMQFNPSSEGSRRQVPGQNSLRHPHLIPAEIPQPVNNVALAGRVNPGHHTTVEQGTFSFHFGSVQSPYIMQHPYQQGSGRSALGNQSPTRPPPAWNPNPISPPAPPLHSGQNLHNRPLSYGRIPLYDYQPSPVTTPTRVYGQQRYLDQTFAQHHQHNFSFSSAGCDARESETDETASFSRLESLE